MKRILKALGLALAAAATLCACSSCYWKGCDGIDERGLKTQGYFHFYEYEESAIFPPQGKSLKSATCRHSSTVRTSRPSAIRSGFPPIAGFNRKL